ncbi:MAG: hypothetical protein V4642_05410 [Bacteroidota bacterium]
MKIALYFVFSLMILVSCKDDAKWTYGSYSPSNNSSDNYVSDEPQMERENIIVKVDSIFAPTNVKNGDRFIAKFYGTISTNGCARLDSIMQNTSFLRGRFFKKESIKFYATRITDRRAMCVSAVVTLGGYGDPYEKEFPPTDRGQFIISVQQPDSTVLEKVVNVY